MRKRPIKSHSEIFKKHSPMRTINSIASSKLNQEDFNTELNKLKSAKSVSRLSKELDKINLYDLKIKTKGDHFIRDNTAENLGLLIKPHKRENMDQSISEGSFNEHNQMMVMMKKFEKIQQEMEKISKQNQQILQKSSLQSTKKSSASLDRMTDENIKDSYVGDINSSLLNKQVLENGDNKNNFLRRGTLVVNSSIQNINESLGQIFQVGKNVIIPEESMENLETFDGLSKSRNKIFDNVNATKDNSQRDLKSNPHLSNPENPFTRKFKGKKEEYGRIIVSESDQLDSEEENKLEKSLIEENIGKHNKSMNKRGKNFDETMNNIYDDLDKTFDHIDIDKEDTDEEVLRGRGSQNILDSVKQDNSVLKGINDRYHKQVSLNIDVKFPETKNYHMVWNETPKKTEELVKGIIHYK